MIPVPIAPFPSPRPLSTWLLSRDGLPRVRVLSGGGTVAVALPNRYSMTHLLLSGDAVVDFGSNEDVPRVLEALRWLGRTPSQVRAVVVSHFHFDHVMGIDALAQRAGCPVAVSRRAWQSFNGGARLRPPPARSTGVLLWGWAVQGFQLLPASDRAVLHRYLDPAGQNPFASPLLPLDDGQELPGMPGWQALWTPGHADDAQALFHREAGFLVTGDTIRNFGGGEWNPVQCDPEAMQQTRRRLSALPVRAVLPGHGPVMEGERILDRMTVIDR